MPEVHSCEHNVAPSGQPPELCGEDAIEQRDDEWLCPLHVALDDDEDPWGDVYDGTEYYD